MPALKLTAKQIKTRSELLALMATAYAELTIHVDRLNVDIRAGLETVGTALDAYNQTRAELRKFVEGIAKDATEDLNDKSERWRESEAGAPAVEFEEKWRTADIDDLDITMPEEIDLKDEDPVLDAISDLPDEA